MARVPLSDGVQMKDRWSKHEAEVGSSWMKFDFHVLTKYIGRSYNASIWLPFIDFVFKRVMIVTGKSSLAISLLGATINVTVIFFL